MTPRGCEDELDWLAFAYVAGDLAADEAEAFERRLADDQLAREAVARAVELTQVVAAAEEHCVQLPVRSNSGRRTERATWGARLSWMAIGGLAMLLVALVWSGWRQGEWRRNAGSQTATTLHGDLDADALARAWSQTRNDLAESDAELWFPDHLESLELPELSSDLAGNVIGGDAMPRGGQANTSATDNEAADSDIAFHAPSWMEAAVLGMAGMTPEEALQTEEAAEPFSSERGDN